MHALLYAIVSLIIHLGVAGIFVAFAADDSWSAADVRIATTAQAILTYLISVHAVRKYGREE